MDSIEMRNVEIKIDGEMANFIVNGVDISDNITKYELVHNAGELPKLIVTMGAGMPVTVDGAVVYKEKKY